MKQKQTQNRKIIVFLILLKLSPYKGIIFSLRNHVFIRFVIIFFKIILVDRKVPLVKESPEYKHY